MEDQHLHDIISQQNMLLAQSLKNKSQNLNKVDEFVKNNPSSQGVTTAPTEEADVNALQNMNVAPDTSAQTFPRDLQNLNQSIESETGVPTNPETNVQSDPRRDVASFKDWLMEPQDPSLPVANPRQKEWFPGVTDFSLFNAKSAPSSPNKPAEAANNGLDSSSISSTSPNANQAAPTPQVNEEQIPSGKQQSVPEIKSPEEVKKAAQVIAQEKGISYDDAVKLSTEQAKNASDFAAQAAKQGKAVIDQIPLLQQRREELYKKADATAAAIQNMAKIDPNRIWNDGSVGNKIAFIISAGFGGLQPGGALDTLMKNDLAGQIKNAELGSENQRGILSMFLKEGDSMREAIQNSIAYYPHYIKALQDQATAKTNLSPEAITAVATKNFNDNRKFLADQHLAVGAKQLELQKTNLEQKNKNAQFAEKQTDREIAANKFLKEQRKFSPETAAVAQQTIDAKAAVKNMYDIESKGIAGFDPGGMVNRAEFKALANEDLSSGVFSNKLNDFITKFMPNLKDAASKSDVANYFHQSLVAAEAKAKNSGARLSEGNINFFLKDLIPSAGIDRKIGLPTFQLNRQKIINNMAIAGGPAAEKILQKNKPR